MATTSDAHTVPAGRAVHPLSVTLPFCRACGTDHGRGVTVCEHCGWASAPLPVRLASPIGDIHTFRKGVRRRPALRVADDEATATLLFESGETEQVEVQALPPVTPSPLAHSIAGTGPGRLLELATAIAGAQVKHRWDPGALAAAAVAAARDQVTARLLAMDALRLRMDSVVGGLPLTASEQAWLLAVRSAAWGDAPRLVGTVASLPASGYRPKLVLVLKGLPLIREHGVDVSGLDAQLRPFFESEPLAAFLHRALGLSRATTSTATTDATWMAAATGAAPQLRRAVDAGVAHLTGQSEAGDPSLLAGLGPSVRAVAALRTGLHGLVGAGEVPGLPDPVVDDLLDSGALDAATALAAPRDHDTALYLTARLVPERLSLDDLVLVGHDEERARRTFPLPDPRAFEHVPDTPLMRHFRSLALVRTNRGDEVDLNDIAAPDRPKVAGLLSATDAIATGRSVVDQLTNAVLLDPTVWPVLAELVGPATLQPSPGLSAQFPAFCEWLALHHAREALYQGDWPAAVAAAERCLALAEGEKVRDEALNLKACGLHYLGDSAGAIAALEEAIDGAYSDALLANIGIVAATLRPDLAAHYLGRLMGEAPTTAMRASAGRRAVAIWMTSDAESWRTTDGSSLPDVIRDPLRDLVGADIELDDFRSFAALLAGNDAAWFREPNCLAHSPHRDSLEARFYQARAGGLEEMIGVMAGALDAGMRPDWLLHERSSLRDAVVEVMFADIDKPDSTLGPVALTMYDKGVIESEYDMVLLPMLGLASTAYFLTDSKDEIADRFVPMLHEVRKRWDALGAEDRTRVAPLVELATRRMAINRMLARDRELSDAIDVHNLALRQMEMGNFGGAVPRMRAANGVATTARKEVEPWIRIVEHDEVRRDLRATLDTAIELEERTRRFL